MFVNQLEELHCNICLDNLAEWWIEPGYLAFPLLTPRIAAGTIFKGARATNYISNNLKKDHIEVCFCALSNTPVDLLNVLLIIVITKTKRSGMYIVP